MGVDDDEDDIDKEIKVQIKALVVDDSANREFRISDSVAATSLSNFSYLASSVIKLRIRAASATTAFRISTKDM